MWCLLFAGNNENNEGLAYCKRRTLPAEQCATQRCVGANCALTTLCLLASGPKRALRVCVSCRVQGQLSLRRLQLNTNLAAQRRSASSGRQPTANKHNSTSSAQCWEVTGLQHCSRLSLATLVCVVVIGSG
jgi:hypothetical protein